MPVDLLVPAYHAVCQLPEEIMVGNVANGFFSGGGAFLHFLGAALQALEIHIGDLAFVLILADGLAEHVFISHHVQHIVADLEGEADLLGVQHGLLPPVHGHFGGDAA